MSTITRTRPGSSGKPKAPGSAPDAKAQPRTRKPTKGEDGRLGDPLADMPELVMAELVGENRQDLVRAVLGEQRIEEHDALGLSEPREISVAVGRALRRVHDEEPFRLEAALAQQSFDPSFHRLVLHRGEAVEERRDEGRVDDQHHEHERHDGDEAEDPPKLGQGVQEEEQAVEQGHAEDEAKRRRPSARRAGTRPG